MLDRYYDIIRAPLLTEKATILAESKKIVFRVAKSADKRSIKNAVEKIFNVKVTKVNVINIQSKLKRFKGRLGNRKDMHKAIVTLDQNSEIDVTGGVK